MVRSCCTCLYGCMYACMHSCASLIYMYLASASFVHLDFICVSRPFVFRVRIQQYNILQYTTIWHGISQIWDNTEHNTVRLRQYPGLAQQLAKNQHQRPSNDREDPNSTTGNPEAQRHKPTHPQVTEYQNPTLVG